MKYSYHPYHKYYSRRAQDEISKVSKLLPTSKIEHFGSTSIPNVGGKGIIDIYVAVPKKDLKLASAKIQKSGYEFKTSGGIPNERLFHQKTELYGNKRKQSFHLHLTYFGNMNWEKSIAFRDFLRKSPQLANEYSEIKHKAVEAAKKFRNMKDKKDAYMAIKKPVIDRITKLLETN